MKNLHQFQKNSDKTQAEATRSCLGHKSNPLYNRIKNGCALAFMISFSAASNATPVVFEAAGATPGHIQSTVDDYRASLGNLNPNVAGSFPDGRREINWDGVPDQFSAPNKLPANFFNANTPRGVVFFTPGTGFQVSAKAVNPTNTPIEFGNIDKDFIKNFSTFSPERLFTAVNSNIVEILFFEPGSSKQATVKGFGAVFTDVDNRHTTKIEYFDVNGSLLYSKHVRPGGSQKESLSFLGVNFDKSDVYLVRITSGDNLAVDKYIKRLRTDAVVMDDFIYSEPEPILEPK